MSIQCNLRTDTLAHAESMFDKKVEGKTEKKEKKKRVKCGIER